MSRHNHSSLLRPLFTRCAESALMLLAVISCNGCLSSVEGEDSWRHYTGGGLYVGATPCMSPDGATIVFGSPRSGCGDIYRIESDGTNRVRLTKADEFEGGAEYSPDGRRIAFEREDGRGRRHIWIMDSDGGSQTQVTSGKVLDDLLGFSPDGKEIYIYRSVVSFLPGRQLTPYAVNLSGKTPLRELNGVPVWSRDGSRVTFFNRFNENTSRFEIWIEDRDGANECFLAAGDYPTWSPDGETILYTLDDDQPGRTWMIIDVDGKNTRKLGKFRDAFYSPDGKHIVCLSPEWNYQILRIDVDGSNRKVIELPEGHVYEVQRSRGTVFLRHGLDRVGDIYFIDTDKWEANWIASIR